MMLGSFAVLPFILTGAVPPGSFIAESMPLGVLSVVLIGASP